jgi:hypothetical protein
MAAPGVMWRRRGLRLLAQLSICVCSLPGMIVRPDKTTSMLPVSKPPVSMPWQRIVNKAGPQVPEAIAENTREQHVIIATHTMAWSSFV